MMYRHMPNIRTAEELGTIVLGNPNASIVPTSTNNRIDRAGYGRRLAKLEGGVFTPHGYFVPIKESKEGD